MIKSVVTKGFNKIKKLATSKQFHAFVVAVAIGITFSYAQTAHAGIVSDIFTEPFNDFANLFTDNVINALAILGVLAGLFTLISTSYMWTGISIAVGSVFLWSITDLIA